MNKTSLISSFSLLLFPLFVNIACNNKHAKQRIATAHPSAQAIQSAHTMMAPLSKDPDFWQFVSPSLPTVNEENLLKQYSPTWIAKSKEIESQVSQINDPDLRRSQQLKLIEKLNREACIKEAKIEFAIADEKYKSQRNAYFSKHKDEWIEIGNFRWFNASEEIMEFEPSKSKLIESNPIKIPIDIPTVDQIFSRYKQIEYNAIRNACETEWSKFSDRIQKVREIYPANEADQVIEREHNNFWSRAEEDHRKRGLILVAKGDVINRTFSSYAIMCYSNGEAIKLISLSQPNSPSLIPSQKASEFKDGDTTKLTGTVSRTVTKWPNGENKATYWLTIGSPITLRNAPPDSNNDAFSIKKLMILGDNVNDAIKSSKIEVAGELMFWRGGTPAIQVKTIKIIK